MELFDIKLKISTSCHPKTDEAFEIMNRLVEKYLRCYCNYHKNDWGELLPTAEFAYIFALTEYIGMSPFEMDFGYLQKSPLDQLHGNSEKNEQIDDFKLQWKESLKDAVHAHKISKPSQSPRAVTKYKPHSNKPGDKVWIIKSRFKMHMPSHRPLISLLPRDFVHLLSSVWLARMLQKLK